MWASRRCRGTIVYPSLPEHYSRASGTTSLTDECESFEARRQLEVSAVLGWRNQRLQYEADDIQTFETGSW
jgi:hypothetical protein